MPFGGPDGGDGGRGGDVVARAVAGLNTLIDYRYQQHFKAQSGRPGAGRDRSGASGDHVALKRGDTDTGGRSGNRTCRPDRGRSGIHPRQGRGRRQGQRLFSNPRRTAPAQIATWRNGPGVGLAAAEAIADAGLLGMPNAGKSTFLAAVFAARPKSPIIRSPRFIPIWGGRRG